MSARRRDFLKAVAVLPASLAVPELAAEEPVPAVSPVAAALAEVAGVRFGAHLEPGDMDEIRKAIDENLKAAERLGALHLGNGDAPVNLFQARVPGARKR